LAESLFALLEPYLWCHTDQKLIPNPEAPHVTLINSNVVAKLDRAALSRFVDAWTSEEGADGLPFRVTGVKTTISKDWCPFARCFVASIECDGLARFVERFNLTFAQTIKVSTNITFAILPRSLWQ
jgi:hypothetical protein